jgi:hypothetical protein
MDITKVSGEELVKIISGEYQKLMLVNQNIQNILSEINRRESKGEDNGTGSGDKGGL